VSTPITAGFHHVSLVTASAARSAGFYRRLLGLTLVSEAVGADDTTPHSLYLGDEGGRPGTLLSIVERRGVPAGRSGAGGVHHVAFGVADETALLKWKRYLSDAGVPVTGPYDRGYFTSIYFADPDGQILEIATEGPGYAIDEPGDSLGRELMFPPQRIVRGHRDEAAIASLTHPEPVNEIDAEMRLSGIHHVSGITTDLARMGDFLEEALGLSLVKKTTNRDAPDMLHYFWARLDGEGVAPRSAYTLFGWPPGWNEARSGVGQADDIAFRARDEEELGAFMDRLEAMDVANSGIINGKYFQSVRFRAPDGQLLSIATDGPGFVVDGDAGQGERAALLG
jgi:glyoxalase family protein